MIIKEGNIIHGKKIGVYELGMKKNIIEMMLGDEYILQKRYNGTNVFLLENAMFFFDKNDNLFQIAVTIGFQGKTERCIGIGDTLTDVKKKYGKVYQEGEEYIIDGIDGIAFGLEDVDDYDDEWNELTAPIEWIYIYQEK